MQNEFVLKTTAVIDNKPVYDHAHGDGVVVKDKRLAIEMILVKKDLMEKSVSLRWVDTKQMLCDAMTKVGIEADLLRSMIKNAEYIVKEEAEVLKRKEFEREARRTKQTQSLMMELKAQKMMFHFAYLSESYLLSFKAPNMH